MSVIIPALNESGALPALLGDLRAQTGLVLEIIVADGGSRDNTVEIARAHGATVVHAPRGRALQMNAGAQAATADCLLFLHADTALPHTRLLHEALTALQSQPDADAVAGHFPLCFQRALGGHEFFYRYLEGKTRLNRPYTINGDQGLLLSRRFYHRIGGYDARLPYLEDQRIAARIFAQGRWMILPGHLITSARRFEIEGHRNAYTLMAILMGLHAAELDEFFTRAPAAYRAMSEGEALDLRPLLRLIRSIFREQGRRRTAKTLWRVGHFVRENTWQLAYHRDLRHGDDTRLPRLRRFERWLEPHLDHPICDLLATIGVTSWFYLWLPLRHSSWFPNR